MNDSNISHQRFIVVVPCSKGRPSQRPLAFFPFFLEFELVLDKLDWQWAIESLPMMKSLRACSHEPGTVNYPGVMIAQGQALPCVHMMICCPGTTLPRVNFIAPRGRGKFKVIWLLRNDLNSFRYYTDCYREWILNTFTYFWCFLELFTGKIFQTLIMSMRKTTLALGQLFYSVHMEKSYLDKAGYPVLYNG